MPILNPEINSSPNLNSVKCGLSIIFIRLEGLLQSYCYDGKWEDRKTDIFPTKSALVGMIGAAMGLPYDSPKLEKISKAIEMSVRCNKKGTILSDYQLIHKWILPDDLEEYQKIVPESQKIRRKSYLVNWSFTAFLRGEEELLKKICEAFMDPAYAPYLGRKNCSPSYPVFAKFANTNDIEEAWETCDLRQCNETCAIEYETKNPNLIYSAKENLLKRDEILANRKFDERVVYRKDIKVCI